MTSPQRLRANRSNCRRSTGPKTQAGRAKSAQNARRHGLRVPVLSDPVLADDVERLAREIADGLGPEFMDFARRIAEAEVDIQRVRRVRDQLVWKDGVDKTINAAEALEELALFHRYERRALSRRTFAIRTLVEASIAAKR
jgi:hypothetical protein